MSESEYIRKISEQASELNSLGKVLGESEEHIRRLEGEIEERDRNATAVSSASRSSGIGGYFSSNIGEMAYKRSVERQLEEARREVESRDKAIEHFQRKNDALSDENEQLRAQLAATQRIRGVQQPGTRPLTSVHDPQQKLTHHPGAKASTTSRSNRGSYAAHVVPTGHPQAPPTIAKYNELRKALKEARDKLASTNVDLETAENDRDVALREVEQLQTALTLNVPVSQLQSQLELLQKLTFLKREVTEMRAAVHGVPLERTSLSAAAAAAAAASEGRGNAEDAAASFKQARLDSMNRIKFMRETDYENLVEGDPQVRLARITNDHVCLLEYMQDDLERATHLAGELDVALAETAALKEMQQVSDTELQTARKVLDDAAHEAQELQAQVDAERVKLKRSEIAFKKACEDRDRLTDAMDQQAEELQVLGDKLRGVEERCSELERERDAAFQDQDREASRAEAFEREMERLAEELGGVRAVKKIKEGGAKVGEDETPMVRRSRVRRGKEAHDNSERDSLMRRRQKELNLHNDSSDADERDEANDIDNDLGSSSLGRSHAVQNEYEQYLARRQVEVKRTNTDATGGSHAPDPPTGISAEALKELESVDAAVGALGAVLLEHLRAMDERSGREGASVDPHSWIHYPEVGVISAPLAHLLGQLHQDWCQAVAAAQEADTRYKHAHERCEIVERAARSAGEQGQAALEEAQVLLEKQSRENAELRSDCAKFLGATSELKVVADLLVNAVDGLDVPDARAAVETLRMAARDVTLPEHQLPPLVDGKKQLSDSHGEYAFGSSVNIGTRLASSRTPPRSGRKSSRTPPRSSSRSPKRPQKLDMSELASPSATMASSRFDRGGETASMPFVVAKPAVLGEAMRVVIKRIARDAALMASSKDECRTLRRRLTEAEMRMELHQREIGALKVAYDSTQDITFLRADSAKGEAEELRRALEDTLAMLEKQNVMQVTLEAKYEAAVRESNERAAQVTVGLQREASSHSALHQVLSRAVDAVEPLADGHAGGHISGDARGRLRALYLPAASVSPYDLIRFAEKLVGSMLACVGVDFDANLPVAPASSYATTRNAFSAPFDQSAVLPATGRIQQSARWQAPARGSGIDQRPQGTPTVSQMPPPPSPSVSVSAPILPSSSVSELSVSGLKPGSRAALPAGATSSASTKSPPRKAVGDEEASMVSTATDVAKSVRSAKEKGEGSHTIASKKLESARAKFQAMRGKDSQMSSGMKKVQLSPKRDEHASDDHSSSPET